MKYIIPIIGVLLLGVLSIKNYRLQSQLSTAIANNKAYDAENTALEDEKRVLRLTVDQLEYSKDSILIKMDSIRNVLKIKDKNLVSIEYLTNTIVKRDTIVFNDTIFRDNITAVDTTLKDEWYNVNLHFSYPNLLTLNPSFKSEKYIVTSYRKETINPPKKFWLFRLFQKKHKILEVKVVEKSPYIHSDKNKFIQIIN